jgi:cell division protein FtsB
MAVISGAAIALGASAAAGTAIAVGVGAAAVSATAGAVGGAIQSGQEHKAMRNARNAKEIAAAKVKELQDGRQDIINPYAGVTDLSGMAKDLTGMMSNPFESLGVATQAAEIQAEEADISLANTLDMLRATGASAGGATALAQAALQSKKGVSASIEQQEATNQTLRAKGQAALTQAKVNEQQRLQSVAISEGQRTQSADAQGKLFEFNAQEDRDNSDISYNISKETGGAQREDAARQRRNEATSGIFTGVGQVAAGLSSTALTAGLTKP